MLDLGVVLEVQTEKNREKMVLKNICFFNIDFFALFCVFLRFWLDFGRSKIIKKLKKIAKIVKKSIFGRFQL